MGPDRCPRRNVLHFASWRRPEHSLFAHRNKDMPSVAPRHLGGQRFRCANANCRFPASHPRQFGGVHLVANRGKVVQRTATVGQDQQVGAIARYLCDVIQEPRSDDAGFAHIDLIQKNHSIQLG